MKLYVDVDENGNIIDALYGDLVVPTKTFDYFFEVDQSIVDNLYLYKVTEDFLTELETLPDVGENIKPIVTTDEEIQQLKNENEMNALAIMDLAELLMGGGA